MRYSTCASLLAATSLATAGSAQPLTPTIAVHPWTLEDIVTVPSVTELALSSDAKNVLFVIQSADLAGNQTRSRLNRITMASHQAETILEANAIEQLVRIPGRPAWSVLIDKGDGLQLYLIDEHGKTQPLISVPAEVTAGDACGAMPRIPFGAPMKIGVLSYAWSPDGRWLWYGRLRPKPSAAVRRGDEVTEQQFNQCSTTAPDIEFHVRNTEGQDFLVATRPRTDRIAFGLNGNVEWRAGGLQFRTESQQPNGVSDFKSYAFNFESHQTSQLPGPSRGFASDIPGPSFSTLETKGFGLSRRLIQHMPDGSSRDRGDTDFVLGDPRSPAAWRSLDGKEVIVGTRSLTAPHYALEWITQTERHSLGDAQSSLSKCDFSVDLTVGICVREGLTQPPQLVSVRPLTGLIEPVASVSPRHDAITPLKVTPRLWTSHIGYKATGFIVWPRNYVAGQRYPAIIVTHGSDSDERFGYFGIQWNYPVQLFAENGYIVLLINDPLPSQNEELWSAYAAWNGAENGTSPAKLRQLVWLNGVASFEDAVLELVRQGIVDPDRVGIAGFSRGSQMVEVTMTHSSLFKAASSGDGDYLDPASYWPGRAMSEAIFGGSPYGPAIDAYRELSPSLRVSSVKGAMLQQLAAPHRDALAFYRALDAAKIPADIELYPGETAQSFETHVFHIPSNRLRANAGNLAWFDIWLSDPKASTTSKMARWRAWTANADRAITSNVSHH